MQKFVKVLGPCLLAFVGVATQQIAFAEPFATLFSDAAYSGSYKKLVEGQYDVDRFKMNWVTSLRVPLGYKVTLYAENNFSGNPKIFTQDINYVGAEIDNLVKSVKVEKIPLAILITVSQFGSVTRGYNEGSGVIGEPEGVVRSIKVPTGYKVTLSTPKKSKSYLKDAFIASEGFTANASILVENLAGVAASGSVSSQASTGGTPSQVSNFSAVVSETQFQKMFPNAIAFYQYQDLVELSKSFPVFLNSSDPDTNKREAAAALANFFHETGGLTKIEEDDKSNSHCSAPANCAPGKSYYGRGPIQITGDQNYKNAGRALALGDSLWSNPEIVATNSTVAWQTALWFWTTQGPHEAITSNLGFGGTINAINGPIECNGKRPDQVSHRVDTYKFFIEILNVTAGPGPTGC